MALEPRISEFSKLDSRVSNNPLSCETTNPLVSSSCPFLYEHEGVVVLISGVVSNGRPIETGPMVVFFLFIVKSVGLVGFCEDKNISDY